LYITINSVLFYAIIFNPLLIEERGKKKRKRAFKYALYKTTLTDKNYNSTPGKKVILYIFVSYIESIT